MTKRVIATRAGLRSVSESSYQKGIDRLDQTKQAGQKAVRSFNGVELGPLAAMELEKIYQQINKKNAK